MQVRARSRVQCNFSTIKLQEGQRGEAKETEKIKASPKNPTGSKASNHEKGKKTNFQKIGHMISGWAEANFRWVCGTK